jgi:hypothetical protein
MTNDKRQRKSGWKQWSANEAREALRAWRESGQTMSEFTRRAGMSAQRLAWWRKRLGAWAGSSDMANEVRLVPVVTSVPSEVVGATAVVVKMRLPGGVVVEFDASQVSPRWVAEVSHEVARAE